MGSGGSSQARFLHGKPSHQTGNCFGFILPVQVSFVFTGWGAVSSFKFSLQPEVSTCWTLLMAWLWEFPWEDDMMTWLFCKLPQVNQVETAKCRDLRLSKSRWEHLGTVVARFVACGMICLTPLAPRFDCLRLKTCAPKPPLLHRKEVVVPVTEWRQYEMLLFDSCLIPVVWFPIHVGRFPNHPFLHSEASLVSQRRSRAALVFAKCIHVLLLHFLREWYYADHPGARCLGSLTQNMLTFLDIYNPEAVWMTGAHSVKWQRPGSWEAQEIRRQRRRRVVLFEVSSSCTSFLAPKFLGRKAVGLEVLVTELGRGPSPSNLRSELLERKRCLNTTLCEKYHNRFGNRGGEAKLRLRFAISAYFRYISSVVIHWLHTHLPQHLWG